MIGQVARYERPILIIAFLLAAIAACLFFVTAVPVGQAPDERAHALRADSLRRGVIVGIRWHAGPPAMHQQSSGPTGGEAKAIRVPLLQAGGLADPALVVALTPFADLPPDARLTPALFDAARAAPWQGPAIVDFPNTIQYPPTFYVGGALALAAAQGLGFGPYDAAAGMRLANAAQFVVLGGLALWLAVAGRLCLFVVLTLPMTLFVASSTSQDGIMIAAAALAAALVSRMWQVPALPVGRLALLALILGAVIMARPTNAPLALLLLLPQAGIAWRRRVAAFAAVTLATLCWSVLVTMPLAVPLRDGVDAAAHVAQIRTAPGAVLGMLRTTLDANIADYFAQMVGRFGLLQILMPDWSLPAYLLPVAAAVIGDMIQPAAAPRTRLVAAVVIVLGGTGLIVIAQYLTWTPVGSAQIEGIQGRYFLPLATVIGLGVAGLMPLAAGWPRGAAVLGVLTGPLIGALAVPGVVMARYYGS